MKFVNPFLLILSIVIGICFTVPSYGDGLSATMPKPAEVRSESLAPRKTLFDFDGDGKADLALYRPSEHNWYILGSAGGIRVITWGIDGDKLAPADYDGDGKADLAVQRTSNSTFYLLKTSAGFATFKFGLAGNLVVPGDYCGDGKTDEAIFTPPERWLDNDFKFGRFH